jgi:hypothetical protein
LKKVELLWSRGDAAADTWLNAHLEHIVALCIQANDAEQIYNFLWPELEMALRQANPILAADVEQKIKELTSKKPEYSFSLDEYTTSPIWQRLHSLYLAAKSGEKAAFYQLRKTAMSVSLIPVQAAATYFIGRLQDHFPDATNLLCKLSHYGLDGWDTIEGCYYHAPVRSEAIKALQWRPSPQVWEELIESFFIVPSNALDLYFDEVIPKVTDTLESGTITHQPIPEEEFPLEPWFDALLDLPDNPT